MESGQLRHRRIRDSASEDRENDYPSDIVPSQALRSEFADGIIHADHPIDDAQIQPASIDLRVGPIAYRGLRLGKQGMAPTRSPC